MVPEGSNPISLPENVSSFEAAREFRVASHSREWFPSAAGYSTPLADWFQPGQIPSDAIRTAGIGGQMLSVIFRQSEKSRTPYSTEPSESHHLMRVPLRIRTGEGYRR